MSVIQLNVNETKLILTQPVNLVGTSVNYDTCKFNFSSEWNGYEKTAVFYSNTNTDPILTLLEDDGSCTIPWEHLQNPGIMYVGVFGMKDNVEIPTNFIPVRITQGAAGKNAPPPPSLSVYAQILNILNNKIDKTQTVVIDNLLLRSPSDILFQLTIDDNGIIKTSVFNGDITNCAIVGTAIVGISQVN